MSRGTNRAGWLGVAACSLALGGLAARGAEPVTHVLFMGTDLAIRREGAFHRVEGVSGDSFRITVNGRPALVPMRPSPTLLKIEPGLKLSRATATIGRLESAATYTAARDPRRRFDAAAGAAAGAAAVADLAAHQARVADEAANSPGANSPLAPPGLADSLREGAADAGRAYTDALAQQGSDRYAVGEDAARLRGAVAAADFDAIEVIFEIAADPVLDDPHVIVIAQYRERGAPAGVSRHWTHATAPGPIGPKPRLLRIREGGLPVGFILEDCRVHVYNRGREVATNVSSRRVDLTREEAWQYLVIERQARQAGASVPPVPVVGDLPRDLPARLAAGRHREPIHVRVNAVGRPQGAFLDSGCTRPVEDGYVSELVAGLLFAPALDRGRPVAGVARLLLGELEL